MRDMFDIRTLSGAVKFLRSMYNFARLVRAGDNAFNSKYSDLCAKLQAPVSGLPTLSSHSAGNKTPRSKLSQLGTLREKSIAEETVIAMGYELSTTSSTVRVQSHDNVSHILTVFAI